MAGKEKLKKNLKLFDVYAISTGAMFSSGFFLLPGIAAFSTGPSAYLAYLAAGILIIPAMFCMAELSTAMPKAGGTYFFLDRALGPMMGTVGGLGSWVAVVFKSAFALVGMGAYLSLYIDVPITLLALILTVVFGIINVVGAKETTLLQRFLVGTLVVILAAYVIKGLAVVGIPNAFYPRASYETFFKEGFIGFAATIGLVFVSYAGLTKVASVAEEIQNPDRNIPLGMTLSLITATLVYTLGMMVMINVLHPDDLYNSLTPVADAGEKFLGWMPFDLGIILIVVAAIAAFASTGNAGIMSASRYPFAMAKDKLLPGTFGKIGRFGTPTPAIVATVATMMFILVVFDVESVAKLASAFQLFLFGLVSICVIVMRESHIESYQPGFRSPFYPWMQIIGLLTSFWLIVEMGILAIGFTGTLAIACGLWYEFYASAHTQRSGAIFHVTARMGQNRYEGLERELMTIVNDKTHDDAHSYESLISRSRLNAITTETFSFDELVRSAAQQFADLSEQPAEWFEKSFQEMEQRGQPLGKATMIWYHSFEKIDQPEMVAFYLPETVPGFNFAHQEIRILFFLISPESIPGLDLRLAGHLAEIVEGRPFEEEWPAAKTMRERRSILMRDDNFYHAPVHEIPYLTSFIGRSLGDFDLPGSCIITLVERQGMILTAKPSVVLQADDEVSIIGEPEDLVFLLNQEKPLK